MTIGDRIGTWIGIPTASQKKAFLEELRLEIRQALQEALRNHDLAKSHWTAPHQKAAVHIVTTEAVKPEPYSEPVIPTEEEAIDAFLDQKKPRRKSKKKK